MAEKITIAVAAANFAHTFPSTVYTYLEKAAGASCELVRLPTTGVEENEKEKLLNALARLKLNGLIGISVSPDKAIISSYTAAGVPIVLIDEEARGVSTVAPDNFTGGYLAGRRFAETGRKTPAIITGRLNVEGSYNSKQRFEGFLKALTESAIKIDKAHIREVISYSYNEGSDEMHAMLSGTIIPDAVFCAAGDMCALGAVKSLREKCVKCPEDIAIIGFDDIAAASTSRPKMTTIRQPIEEMAATAYRLCAERREDILKSPQKVLYKPELIVRESA